MATARSLNALLHEAFDESQIFRIDHFLGKETVQNILALRFANGIFETIWNRHHIDHVQIDVPETLSIGSRGYFYEGTGAFRDMLVTHLLQVLGFVAMEPPTSFEAKALVDETVKVFEAMTPLRPEDVVRGQYRGYRETPGVAPDSETETFVAARVFVDNWRWAGVPFYLRTGKLLAERRRTVTIAFRDPPRRMFGDVAPHGPSELVFELGEPGSISSSFLAKMPGPDMRLGPARLSFRYEDSFQTSEPARGVRAADPRRDARRPDALHARGRCRAALGGRGARCSTRRRRSSATTPGSWGPAAAERLSRPARWHLPDSLKEAA